MILSIMNFSSSSTLIFNSSGWFWVFFQVFFGKDAIQPFCNWFCIFSGGFHNLRLIGGILRANDVDLRCLRQFGGDEDLRVRQRTDFGKVLGFGDRIVANNLVNGHWAHVFSNLAAVR